MGFFLLASVIILLVAEFSVMAWVMDAIGALNAVGLLLAVSLVGAWLTKRAGLGAARRIRQTTAAGRTPSAELTDGALIVLAGILLVLPGFVTGAMGALLLLPPVRALARVGLQRRFRAGRRTVMVRSRTRDGRTEVWDVESWEEPGRGSDRTEIGGSR